MHMKCSLHPDMHVSGEDCSEQSPSELTESISVVDGSGHQIWSFLQTFLLSGKLFFSDLSTGGHLYLACFLPKGGMFEFKFWEKKKGEMLVLLVCLIDEMERRGTPRTI